MPVEIAQELIDVVLNDYEGDAPTVSLFPLDRALTKKEKALRCLVSLMGETRPSMAPLSPSYFVEKEPAVHRYDWTFGIACLDDKSLFWNWQQELRDDSAVAVQLVVPTTKSITFSELSLSLLALEPSRDTRSWLETYGASFSEMLTKIADPTRNLAPSALGTSVSAVLRASAAMSNFVTSGESGEKNWFVYRILDPQAKACAIEWRINKRVLKRYGPLLRGSIVLAFHGTVAADHGESIRLMLRPKLGFHPKDEICFVDPTEADGARSVQLAIVPQM